MGNLLIDERPIMFLPKLAKALGSCERAIVLQQIHWLSNQPNSGKVIDGEHWVWGTYEEWCRDYFSMWTPVTLKHHIRNLEKQGVLISAQLRAHEHDQTKYYRIKYEHELLSSTGMGQHVISSKGQYVTPSIEQDVIPSKGQDAIVSSGQDVVDSINRTETPTETPTEIGSSSSSASSSTSEKNDDDDDLTFKSVLLAWNEGMPETATKHIRRKLKDLIAECGPDTVIAGILAAVEASGRSFKYVATCARNLAAPGKAGAKDGYRVGDVDSFAGWTDADFQAEIERRDAEAVAKLAAIRAAKLAKEPQP